MYINSLDELGSPSEELFKIIWKICTLNECIGCSKLSISLGSTVIGGNTSSGDDATTSRFCLVGW